MHYDLFLAVTKIGKEYRFLGLDWNWLVLIGLIGNGIFSMRFLVQWIASERKGESVIPVSFWYWSIGGSVVMCFYFHLSAGSGRHPGVSAELLHLLPQSAAGAKKEARPDRRRTEPDPERGRLIRRGGNSRNSRT